MKLNRRNALAGIGAAVAGTGAAFGTSAAYQEWLSEKRDFTVTIDKDGNDNVAVPITRNSDLDTNDRVSFKTNDNGVEVLTVDAENLPTDATVTIGDFSDTSDPGSMVEGAFTIGNQMQNAASDTGTVSISLESSADADVTLAVKQNRIVTTVTGDSETTRRLRMDDSVEVGVWINTKGEETVTANITIEVAPDASPFHALRVSRWSFDDSATDSGTALDVWNTNDGAINGATTGVSGPTVTYDTGKAYDFDGSDDYIDLPTGLDGTYQTVSVFIWMKTDTLNKDFQGLLSSDSYDEGHVHFQLNDDELQFGQSGGVGLTRGGTIINKDQWHHVGYTFDTNGDVSLYIDGEKIGSNTAKQDVVLKNLVIGRSNDARYFDGTLDDPRVFDKTLTEKEVKRLYHLGNINYPSASAISRWSFDDSATDSGTALDVWNGNDGTINGATTGASGANQTYDTGEAYDFDGTDDWIDVDADANTLPTGDSNFAIAFWANPSATGQKRWVVTLGESTDNNGYITTVSQNRVRFHYWGYNKVFDPSDTNTNLSDFDGWHHYVITREDAEQRCYIDGGLEISTDLGGATPNLSDNNLQIGKQIDFAEYYGGLLDDVRIYDKPLTDTDVERLYNVGAI